MKFTLYTADCTGNAKNTIYRHLQCNRRRTGRCDYRRRKHHLR